VRLQVPRHEDAEGHAHAESERLAKHE
jgi:hypothetical protein